MSTNPNWRPMPGSTPRNRSLWCFLSVVLGTLICSSSGWATSVTSDPANNATGVSVTAPVVFTFSGAMNTEQSAAIFQSSGGGFYITDNTWNAAGTVLTCTPQPAFPDNTNITWQVIGFDASMSLVMANGSFSTGTNSSGGGNGSGTNKITTFSAGKSYLNQQTNSGAASPVDLTPYTFAAVTSLASNRVATAVTVTLPSGATNNLNQVFSQHEDYNFFNFNASQTVFETTYADGNYVFNVTGTPNNLQGTVSIPSTMKQPNVPHISNWTAAQSLDATKAFVLTWDPFQNGTSADFITVSIEDIFKTPDPGTNGALTGTATSVTIPANRLAANTNYSSCLIVFYRYSAVTNANYAAVGYKATGTEFEVTTAGSVAVVPTVSNAAWSGGSLGFDVDTAANQTLKVLFSPNVSLPLSQWQTIFTTNSPGSKIHIATPPQNGLDGFFRVQAGP